MKLNLVILSLALSKGTSFVSPFVPSSSITGCGCARSRPSGAGARAGSARAGEHASPVCMAASKADIRATAVSWTLAAALLVASPLLAPSGASAISGGGLDYSGLDLTGKNFSMGKYKSKDFSGAIAKEVNFKGSDLRGVRFFKADLKKADFTGANLGTASLEEADLEGAILTDAVATGSYLGNNMGNVGNISGADFTDALIRKDVAKALCARPDAKGTNPTTGTDTRDSLLCDMF